MRRIFLYILSFVTVLFVTITICPRFVFAVEPYELLPIDVIYYPNHLEIRKIYEMSASVDPAKIPRASFERDNIKYKNTDILREVKIGTETKAHIEVETIDSAKNDIESILKVLPLTKEILTEDGFYGILYINTSTIKSEIAGYGSTSRAVSVTRSYPNLYDMDSQHIPKSVTENNITYTLSDIQWQTDNRYNADDYEIGNRYTAIAIYSGMKTSSYVKGYKITVEYTGELCRTGVSVIRYTVIFAGTKIEPIQTTTVPKITEPETESSTEEIKANPELAVESENITDTEPETTLNGSETQKTSGFNWLFVIIPLLLLAAAAITGAIIYLNKRKEQPTHEEENIDCDNTDSDNNDNDSDADACDGDCV